MLQKRDQGRRHGNQLIGGHVHHLDVFRHGRNEVAAFPDRNQFFLKFSLFIERPVRRGNELVFLFDSRHVFDIIEHFAVLDQAVRAFDEAEFVHARVRAEGDDQADIRAFRRLDRTDAAVMRRMNVADLKPGALPCEAAGPQRRQAAFVRDFRKRIRLVHELGELAGAEKFIHHSRHRFGVDQVVRHHGFDVLKAHLFLDRPLHAHQADAVLIFNQFADGAHPAVPQMINVVHAALAHAVFQIDQIFDGGQNIFVAQNGQIRRHIQPELIVHLGPADIRQIIGFQFKKEAVEKLLRGLRSGRIAGPEPAVDFHNRVFRGVDAVHEQRVANGGVVQVFIDMDEVQFPDPLLLGNLKAVEGKLFVAAEKNFARRGILNIRGKNFPGQIRFLDRHALDPRVHDLLEQGAGELAPFLDDDFIAFRVFDIFRRLLPGQGFINPEVDLFPFEGNFFNVVEIVQKKFRRIAHGFEQNRDGHLAAAVDANVQQILGIEFQIQPGAADGNDARRINQFAGGDRFSLVVIKKDPGRPVQLADDHAFRSVDDKRAVFRHQRNFTEVNFLFLNVADRFGLGRFTVAPAVGQPVGVKHHQTDHDFQRSGIGHAFLNALLHVVPDIADLVADKFQGAFSAEVRNRENALKSPLQADIAPFGQGHVGLQELFVGPCLDLDQIGNVLYFFYATKIFSKVTHGILEFNGGVKITLFNLDRSADFLDLLLDFGGFLFGNGFFNRFGHAFHQIFGFFQAQAGDGANDFDDLNLLRAESRQNGVELRLFFRCRRGARGLAGHRHGGHHGSGGGHAEFFFQFLHQIGKLQHGHVFNKFNDIFFRDLISHFSIPLSYGFMSLTFAFSRCRHGAPAQSFGAPRSKP